MVVIPPKIEQEIWLASKLVFYRYFSLLAGFTFVVIHASLYGYRPLADTAVLISALITLLYNIAANIYLRKLKKKPDKSFFNSHLSPLNLIFITLFLDAVLLNLVMFFDPLNRIVFANIMYLVVFAGCLLLKKKKAAIIVLWSIGLGFASLVFNLYPLITSKSIEYRQISDMVAEFFMVAFIYIILYMISRTFNRSAANIRNECRRINSLNNILMNTVEEGVVIFDKKNIITYINDGACAFFGISYNQAVGNNINKIFFEGDIKKIKERLKRGALAFKEKARFRADGGTKPVVYSLKRIVSKEPEETLLVFRDISILQKHAAEARAAEKELEGLNRELRNSQLATLNILEDVEQARQELNKEKNHLQAILQGVADAVIAVDQNENIILVNPAAAELGGFNQDEAIDKNIHEYVEFFVKDDKKNSLHKTIIRALEGEEIKFPSDAVLVKKGDSGKSIPIGGSAGPIFSSDNKTTGMVFAFRDVTAEREIDRRKNEFISVASHQLRTPLSAIKWFLEMVIEEDAGEINKEQRDYLEQVYKSNQRMIKLVNDLLNVSRIEAGRVGVDAVPTDMINLIGSVRDELKHKMDAKNIKFKFIKPDKLKKIKLDPRLTREAMMNLIDNAIKYSPEGKQIVVKLEKKGKDVVISIKDEGYGIPKEEQGRVFKKFFRATNIIKRETEGTGLGLYVTKRAIESMDGDIWFESKKGKGTTFYVKLPLAGVKPKKGETSLV